MLLIGASCSYGDGVGKCFDYLDEHKYQIAINYGMKLLQDAGNIYYSTNPYLYACMGIAYLNIGNAYFAIQDFKKSEMYFSLKKDKKDLMYIYTWLGNSYKMANNSSKAFEYYYKSLQLAKPLGYKNVIAADDLNLANILIHAEFKASAIDYYKEYIRLKKDYLDRHYKQKVTIYNNLALAYENYKDNLEKFVKYNKEDLKDVIKSFKDAVKYYNKAIDISLKHKDYARAGLVLSNLGNMYVKEKDFENAKRCFDKALKYEKMAGDKNMEAVIYKYLGFYYEKVGDYKKAEECLRKSYNLFNATESYSDASNVQNELNSLIKELKERSKDKKIGITGIATMSLILPFSIFYLVRKAKYS